MAYKVAIGLEVHAQLKTESKIFCGCSTRFGTVPNSNTCPVCLGLPGVLPVLNRKVVEYTLRAALATHCNIAMESLFARKNYFYPDLPKDYQISQYEEPIAYDGYLDILMMDQSDPTHTGPRERRIGITRIHMEEDAGKLIHGEGEGAAYSLVDFNRTGIPLIEIVSEPDISSPFEASQYLKTLRNVLRYLDICDGNMEEGEFRCDANVSIAHEESLHLGTKTELKNMNSFRHVQRALEYEVNRQKTVLEEGGEVVQETRLWDAGRGVTVPMRGKEEAHDYRYFPDPDLLPVKIDNACVKRIQADLPELPLTRMRRFIKDYGLPPYDATILTESRRLADYFERCMELYDDPKVVSNWITVELLRGINRDNIEVDECKVTPRRLTNLLILIDKGRISGKTGKQVFKEMYRNGLDPGEIVRKEGLTQISDIPELKEIVEQIIQDHPEEKRRFEEGEDKLIGFFMGQAMKKTRGQANPKILSDLFKERLSTLVHK